jgi:hypothetical protein
MIIALSLFVEFIFSWLNYSSLSVQNISDCPSIWLSYTIGLPEEGGAASRASAAPTADVAAQHPQSAVGAALTAAVAGLHLPEDGGTAGVTYHRWPQAPTPRPPPRQQPHVR